MRNKEAIVSLAIAFALATVGRAETQSLDPVAPASAKKTGGQQMLELPIRVVDANGKPVAQAKVTPWALRSSQGHGWWRKDDERAGVGPQQVLTKEDGMATVLYPQYRDVPEHVQTLSVSVYVDHPDFAYVDRMHIDVPLETKGPYEIKLAAGIPVEIRPLIDGKPADLDNLFAIWSDGRSWSNGAAPEKMPGGTLRIPAMPPGKNSVLLVKLDGDHATHFSKLTDFELTPGEPAKFDLPLLPSRRIEGKLSDNVPRPVGRGRIKTSTLAPAKAADNRVEWFSWTPIRPDGTFTIDGWPAGERLQLIALCDGYLATSGKAPDVVEQPREPGKDPYNRPQVFDLTNDEPIEVTMTPLVRCVATAVDGDNKPVAGINVMSWPNVGWWNDGSQIYGDPLARGERLLRERDYQLAIEKVFPPPFIGKTDARGQVSLDLPAGSEALAIESEVYELPVFLGRRDIRIKLVRGQTTEATLRLQPVGTEKLGEWDKLAGVVFGCSTREGRRICALPGVEEKMEKFAALFREAKNQHDPQLLSEAYTAVADAFAGVGDQEEGEKWRKKAAEKAAKVNNEKPATTK